MIFFNINVSMFIMRCKNNKYMLIMFEVILY